MTASSRAGTLWGWKRRLHALGHKYEMRIDEVTSPLKTFLAQIRAKGLTARTTVQADSLSQARAILVHVYGQENVQMVTQMESMTNETATIKPETPAQARVKSLADQAANLKKQEKVARAQIGLKRAQARMQKANLPTKPR
jgi:hypothetical protein